MDSALSLLDKLVFQQLGLPVTECVKDPLAREYEAADFKLGERFVKFRKAKLTPKKNGQFVTLWKRDAAGISTPYHTNDRFDCSIIVTEEKQALGFFLFPKAVLAKHAFISTQYKEGKRGFRLYTAWDSPMSKQAAQTKDWQAAYFIQLNKDTAEIHEKFKLIFNTINQ